MRQKVAILLAEKVNKYLNQLLIVLIKRNPSSAVEIKNCFSYLKTVKKEYSKMKRYYLPFSFLVYFAVISVSFGISLNKVKGAPANKERYCYHLVSVPNDGYLSPLEFNSRINLREQPGTRFNIRHVISGGPAVSVFKRVMGEDGYCWFQVQLNKSNVKGWVRGDFLDMGDRD